MKTGIRTLKNLLLATLAVTALSAPALGGDPGDGKTSPLAARPGAIDFGKVLSGEVVVKEIRLLNRSNERVTIARITFTCGCTIPEITLPSGRIVNPEKIVDGPLCPLEAGEACTIRLAFQARTLAGPVARSLFVHAPGEKEPLLTLPVTAVVRPAFTIEPRRIDFGSVRWSGPVTRSVTVRSAGVGPFAIGEISGLPPYFTAKARSVKGSPVPTWRIDVSLEKKPPAGAQSFILHCRIDSRRISSLKLQGSAEIEPDVVFRASPGNGGINFGVIAGGTATSAVVDVTNTDRTVPYDIDAMRIESAHSEFFKLRLHTLEAGIHHKIFFTVDPRLRTRFFRGRIVLTSSHPDLGRKEISFKGWINLPGDGDGKEAP